MIEPDQQHGAADAQPPRAVLYVGHDPDPAEAALKPLAGRLTFQHESRVSAALLTAARSRPDVAIIDLTTNDHALTLLTAAMAGAHTPPRLVVLARPDDVSRYLHYPGVSSVVTIPLQPRQLRAAAMAGTATLPVSPEPPPSPAAPAPETSAENFKSPDIAQKQARRPGWRLRLLSSGPFMRLVSALYKNTAFVLLAGLFAAFSFYGFLIAYFLLATGWGAPMTLTRGHQLVEKAINDIGELKVGLSISIQHENEAALEASKALAAQADAQVLVDFMRGTIASEIDIRNREIKASGKAAERIAKVIAEFHRSGSENQLDPHDLYRKRLITKRYYDNMILGSLEANQRLAMLEADYEQLTTSAERIGTTIGLLTSLKRQLETGKVNDITSGSADLILLTKEAVNARSTLDQAITQAESAKERQQILVNSAELLRQRIAEIEAGALGRAAKQRIDVIFVPYGNERQFQPGEALYTCVFTVVICHRAGTVGLALPGESTAVHPFFGKPLRGYFVEAALSDPEAASEEIIHAGRPPFFF